MLWSSAPRFTVVHALTVTTMLAREDASSSSTLQESLTVFASISSTGISQEGADTHVDFDP
jgi:hypothetical protein